MAVSSLSAYHHSSEKFNLLRPLICVFKAQKSWGTQTFGTPFSVSTSRILVRSERQGF